MFVPARRTCDEPFEHAGGTVRSIRKDNRIGGESFIHKKPLHHFAPCAGRDGKWGILVEPRKGQWIKRSIWRRTWRTAGLASDRKKTTSSHRRSRILGRRNRRNGSFLPTSRFWWKGSARGEVDRRVTGKKESSNDPIQKVSGAEARGNNNAKIFFSRNKSFSRTKIRKEERGASSIQQSEGRRTIKKYSRGGSLCRRLFMG